MRNWQKSLVAGVMLAGFGACAAMAQTTVSGSVFGAFRSRTKIGPVSSRTVESPSNVAGVLAEVRHVSNPIMGYEVSYSYHRMDESYRYSLPTPACVAPGLGTPPCGPTTLRATAATNANEVAGDWVLSLPMPGLRIFVLLGGGALVDDPAASSVTETTTVLSCEAVNPFCAPTVTTSSIATRTVTEGFFQYGLGADWRMTRHFGARFQLRGNLYRSPNVTKAFPSTGKFTQEVDPTLGVFYRF